MSFVLCRMPKAGLGNQLFPLMKAVVKKELLGIPLIVTNYQQFSIGPYLRREKSKRRYQGYFVFQKGLFQQWIDKLTLRRFRNLEVVKEADLEVVEQQSSVTPRIYEYGALPHYSDYFKGLKDHRALVLKHFDAILTPFIKEKVAALEAPCIGVHIRMGDFRKLKAGEDFAKVGAVRTPEAYFIEVIKGLRTLAGKPLPVTVFTDGYRHEFEELFDLPNISMSEHNPDIVDMILLSKSKVIVTSADSTFSYWAGFLSDAALIVHPDHIHNTIRPAQMGSMVYEGPFKNANGDIDSKLRETMQCL